MRQLHGAECSLENKLAIYKEIPQKYQYLPNDFPHAHLDEDDLYYLRVAHDPDRQREWEKQCSEDRRRLEKFLRHSGTEVFGEACQKAARKVLPGYLTALCTETARGFNPKPPAYESEGDGIWFMADPVAAVFAMMDRRAKEGSARLAVTSVTQKVFDALDYALQERAMVRIEGNSRFGKTESIKAWVNMRPGLARLVTVPCSNSMGELLRRIADALGIETSYGSRVQRLRERTEYVIQHSGLFLVFDEFHFMLPQNYSSGTAPMRINWVRTEIVDRNLPLAAVVTPQSFLPAAKRFIRKTGYAFEQFFGRTHRVVQLPEELEEAEMISVARIHFPEIGDDYLALIADYARLSENYLQAVEAIAKLARHIARRENHRRITVADIEAAASEVIPRRPAATPSPIAQAEAKAQKAAPGTDYRPVNEPLKSTARAIRPVRSNSAEITFAPRSLRGAGPGRVETELVPAET